ncbi:MAG: hypothetical protein HQ596_03750 [Candidatus Saganbacteria bacterium]|nr:hypothetical protein [Candidatus Saganbacteria bacterium]
MGIKDKLLVSSAYLFGVPALYIVLTDSRKKEYIGGHGAAAFRLWVIFFVIFFALRFFVNLIWSYKYIPQLGYFELLVVVGMGIYALFAASKSLINR